MYQTIPLIELNGDCQEAILLTTNRLASEGLEVMRSFDLQAARASHTCCNCPHHDTDECNCHMVVLLVYEQEKQPVTLIAHGYDGVTYLVLVDRPDQRPDPMLVATIRHILSFTKPADMSIKLNSHAT